MAFKKSDAKEIESKSFEDFGDALKHFENLDNAKDDRLDALKYMVEKEDVTIVLNDLIRICNKNDINDHIFIDYVFTHFKHRPKGNEEFDKMLKMLQSENVYLRNMVIKYLQDYGSEAKVFIKSLMDSKDKDIRIFAINILGDVKYEDSVDMLRYFIAQEGDINAIMTAVDYLGEIGSENDIQLLEALKKEHKDNPYVVFGVDVAINRIRG